MYLNHKTNCQTGDPITAEDWNHLASDVNELGTGGGNGSSSGGNVSISNDTVTDPSAGVSIVTGVDLVGTAKVIELTKKKKGVNTTIVSENNINLEPRESVDSTKGGNISFKPGDDIEFCSHHRVADSQDEVSVKVIDGDDNPVKLLLNAASMTLTTKDKTGNDANVFDINVNSGKNTKGYLKVRALAIDLRCEDHGGVALQPKGEDSDHHMNKIKFEHGGGDGLEFGTFNTEKTSLFTDEYRFNKNGVVKLATRTKTLSDKYDNSDETTHYKYVKAADDFYDNINSNDPQCTWEDLITTTDALNSKFVKTQTINNFTNDKLGALISSGIVSIKIKSANNNEIMAYRDEHPDVYSLSIIEDDTIRAFRNLEELNYNMALEIGKVYTIEEFQQKYTIWFGGDLDWNSILGPDSNSAVAGDGYKFIKFTRRYNNLVENSILWIDVLTSDIIFADREAPSSPNTTFDLSTDHYVTLSDIIKYIRWAKTNHEGPWTN